VHISKRIPQPLKDTELVHVKGRTQDWGKEGKLGSYAAQVT